MIQKHSTYPHSFGVNQNNHLLWSSSDNMRTNGQGLTASHVWNSINIVTWSSVKTAQGPDGNWTSIQWRCLLYDLSQLVSVTICVIHCSNHVSHVSCLKSIQMASLCQYCTSGLPRSTTVLISWAALLPLTADTAHSVLQPQSFLHSISRRRTFHCSERAVYPQTLIKWVF